ncbi:DUF1620-domain-containing protein [Dentipellis sp. KUC8613]|nr:DUF1620-domain-containing protein [Dentipellis sp. KUC8613]
MRWLLSALFFVPLALGLHESEAGVVDWHRAQVGVPSFDSISTAPSFRTTPRRPPEDALLLTATSSNVLAALYARNGSIAWRYIYDATDNVVSYHKHNDFVVSLSGPGGSTLRTFEYATGHLIVEKHLHQLETGRLFEPADVGTSVVSPADETSDVFVLTNGRTIRRVDGSGKGAVHWTWDSPDQTSLVIYSKLLATPTTLYALGLSKSFASYTLHVTSINPTTGEVISSADVHSSITDGPDSIVVLRAHNSQATARAVWTEAGAIHSVLLTPQLKSKPASLKSSDAAFAKVLDVGVSEKGLVIAQKANGATTVVKLEESGDLKAIWDYVDSATSQHNAESVYTSGVDPEGIPYVARVYWSHAMKKASVHVYAPHLADGKGLVSGYTFPFDTNTNGIIAHAALHAAFPKPYDVSPFLAVTTTTGAVQFWFMDKPMWTREEGLALIAVAEMVELPEPETGATAQHAGETFVQRVERQVRDARDFPQYLVHFVKRFLTGSYASASAAPTTSTVAAAAERDAFGFRKIVVAAGEHGKVYGLDASNGAVLWSRVYGLGWAAQVGGRVVPTKVFVVRTVADADVQNEHESEAEAATQSGNAKNPHVVVVAQRIANNGLVDTVLFHIDALTGADVTGASDARDVLQGVDVISGPLLGAYLLEGETKNVALLDEFRQVYLYPDTPASARTFAALAPSLHLPLRTGTPGARSLTGHTFALGAGLAGRAQAQAEWTTALPAGEEVIALVQRPAGPVASLGRVLGNRTTLYKYLNANLVGVLTRDVTAGKESGCGVYVLDGAKGSVVYHAALPGDVDAEGKASGKGRGCAVHAAFVENWLVYVYWDPEWRAQGAMKGWKIVSVEFYEGKGVDDRTGSADMSSYSPRSLEFMKLEQSFVFPHGISAMAVTQTKFGVSVKDIIVANELGQIQSFSRRMLDPRRPLRKVTAEEQEEMLVQYDPIIPDDPRRVLSHRYKVANIRHILTSPALLESTSLIFAYGLDLFGTRVAPSGTFDVLSEEFNKAQLVLTVCGLAAAIMVTRPMVSRKKLREKWY